MGQSLCGMLVYGWDLGYDDPPEWAEEFVETLREADDFEDALLELSGFVNPHPDPWDEIRDKPSEWFRDPGPGWGNSPEYAQWLEDSDAARNLVYDAKSEAMEALGAEIVLYGGDHSGLILSVPGANVESFDWGVKEVDMEWVESVRGLYSKLFEAARQLGLSPDTAPAMLVAASYG